MKLFSKERCIRDLMKYWFIEDELGATTFLNTVFNFTHSAVDMKIYDSCNFMMNYLKRIEIHDYCNKERIRWISIDVERTMNDVSCDVHGFMVIWEMGAKKLNF